uniref:GPI ethanolamine phosphate transferase 1 n=2 Tax=Caenorhabditis japonica TaxID=281687 RepID=A0A8R1HRK0_CAEJA
MPYIVESDLKKLSSRCNTTPENIPSIFLKRCCTTIALPLSIIFNKSITSGTMPNDWKRAVVKPLYKKDRRFHVATSLFAENAHLMKEAIVFYHRYDRQMLGAAVSCTFVAWIALVVSRTFKNPSHLLTPSNFFVLPLLFSLLFALYCSPTVTQTIYIILPVYLISVLENHAQLAATVKNEVSILLRQPDWHQKLLSVDVLVKPFVGFVGFSITICIFVLTFIHRGFLAAVFLLLLLLLPLPHFFYPPHPTITSWTRTWTVLLLFLSIFPFLPAVVLSPILLAISCHRLSRRPSLSRLENLLKLMTMVPYSLLSISYESLFVLFFLLLLALFLRFEFAHLSDVELLQLKVDAVKTSTSIHVELRRALICVSLVLGTLFGTGNFASINSFNPSILLFISVFSPFTMAILLVLKLLLPILLVASTIAAIVRFSRHSIQRLCCLVLIFTHFMSMCFFHQLKDDGSWLDIGMSISQFIVSMCISLALLVLLSVSSHLMAMDFYLIRDRIRDRSLKNGVEFLAGKQ